MYVRCDSLSRVNTTKIGKCRISKEMVNNLCFKLLIVNASTKKKRADLVYNIMNYDHNDDCYSSRWLNDGFLLQKVLFHCDNSWRMFFVHFIYSNLFGCCFDFVTPIQTFIKTINFCRNNNTKICRSNTDTNCTTTTTTKRKLIRKITIDIRFINLTKIHTTATNRMKI